MLAAPVAGRGCSGCNSCAAIGSAARRHVKGPGIEPMSPALAGGFLTPGPPGKST